MLSLSIKFAILVGVVYGAPPEAPTGTIENLNSSQLYSVGWKEFLRETDEFKGWCKANHKSTFCITSHNSLHYQDADCAKFYYKMIVLMISHVANPEQLETIDETLLGNYDFCKNSVEGSGTFVTRYGSHSKDLSVVEWKHFLKTNYGHKEWCINNTPPRPCVSSGKIIFSRRRCRDIFVPLSEHMKAYNNYAGVETDVKKAMMSVEQFCPAPITCTTTDSSVLTATPLPPANNCTLIPGTTPILTPGTTSTVTPGNTSITDSSSNMDKESIDVLNASILEYIKSAIKPSSTSYGSITSTAAPTNGTTPKFLTAGYSSASSNNALQKIGTSSHATTTVSATGTPKLLPPDISTSSNNTNGLNLQKTGTSFHDATSGTNLMLWFLVLVSAVLLVVLFFGCLYAYLFLQKSRSATFN